MGYLMRCWDYPLAPMIVGLILGPMAESQFRRALQISLGDPFVFFKHPGSAALLALADNLVELKAVCDCGRKATMNLRVDAEGHAVAAGAQTEIGGNDRYVALCRRHFFERLREGEARQLSLGLARR
jgi:thymidine kinase